MKMKMNNKKNSSTRAAKRREQISKACADRFLKTLDILLDERAKRVRKIYIEAAQEKGHAEGDADLKNAGTVAMHRDAFELLVKWSKNLVSETRAGETTPTLNELFDLGESCNVLLLLSLEGAAESVHIQIDPRQMTVSQTMRVVEDWISILAETPSSKAEGGTHDDEPHLADAGDDDDYPRDDEERDDNPIPGHEEDEDRESNSDSDSNPDHRNNEPEPDEDPEESDDSNDSDGSDDHGESDEDEPEEDDSEEDDSEEDDSEEDDSEEDDSEEDDSDDSRYDQDDNAWNLRRLIGAVDKALLRFTLVARERPQANEGGQSSVEPVAMWTVTTVLPRANGQPLKSNSWRTEHCG